MLVYKDTIVAVLVPDWNTSVVLPLKDVVELAMREPRNGKLRRGWNIENKCYK